MTSLKDTLESVLESEEIRNKFPSNDNERTILEKDPSYLSNANYNHSVSEKPYDFELFEAHRLLSYDASLGFKLRRSHYLEARRQYFLMCQEAIETDSEILRIFANEYSQGIKSQSKFFFKPSEDIDSLVKKVNSEYK